MTVHKHRGVVVAQAAAPLSELAARVADAGRSLPVNVPVAPGCSVVGEALLGGAVGGAGLAEGLLADCVLEMSLVDASGRLRVYSKRDPPALFEAVKVSYGLFGVLYDVTLRLDMYQRVVEVCNRFMCMREVGGTGVGLDGVRRLVEERVAVEMLWIPFNSWKGGVWAVGEDLLWVRTMERVETGRDEQRQPMRYKFWTVPQWFRRHGKALAEAGYGGYRAADVKQVLGIGFRESAGKLEARPSRQRVSDAVQMQYAAETWPVVSVAVAVPLQRGEDWKVVEDIWRVVREKVVDRDARGEYPLNVGVRMRFVKASAALMAANFGKGKKVYSVVVEICSAVGTKGWTEFAREVVAEWMRLPGARCQLSEEMTRVCDADALAVSFGDNLEEFKRLRQNAGVDDIGMFLNEPFAQLLGMDEDWSELSCSPLSSVEQGGTCLSRTNTAARIEDRATSDGSIGTIECPHGIMAASMHGEGLTPTASAAPSQASLSWTAQSSTNNLVSSSFCSKTSMGDENGVCTDEEVKEYNWDKDDDDSSLISVDDGDDKPTVFYRKLSSRPKRLVKFQSPLSQPEFSLLVAYIALYIVLWMVMFGSMALQQLGWFSGVAG